MKYLSIAVLSLSTCLSACTPDTEPEAITIAEDEASTAAPPAPKETLPPIQGNTRLYVTISCKFGTIPGTDVSTMPINAYVAIVDEKYGEDITARMIAGEENFDPFISDNIGEDGIIDFNFDEDRTYDIAVASMDERLELGPGNVSDHAWNRVKIKKGETLHKDFTMTQFWCDKDRAIRGIEPSSYNIQVSSFGTDYDDTASAGFGVDKQFYSRANSGGTFKYYAHYGTNLSGKKRGPYLEDGRKSMIINNVQTEKRIKRVCGSEEDSLDMTIKSDGALGVKTYSGTIGGDIVNCAESYAAHYPFTYAENYRDANTPAVELYIRHVDSHNNRQRSNCPAETLAKIDTPSIAYPGGCMESAIIHTNVFEAGSSSGVFPWGKLHKYSHRFDLTKLEEVKGKVPPTILP